MNFSRLASIMVGSSELKALDVMLKNDKGVKVKYHTKIM